MRQAVDGQCFWGGCVGVLWWDGGAVNWPHALIWPLSAQSLSVVEGFIRRHYFLKIMQCFDPSEGMEEYKWTGN